MKTTIDVISGFLGAGKTTLIKKLLKEGLQNEKVVLIENEFGEIGIDGGFLKEAGVQITEMNSGCICCTLVGDFGKALREVLESYAPDRVLIEPSGVGKLSDVVQAVQEIAAKTEGVQMGGSVTVADVSKCKMYMKNFGEFYNNQIESAGTIVLSRTQKVSEDKVEECVGLLREHNAKASIITTPWDELSGEQILAAMAEGSTLEEELLAEAHHHDHEEGCCCHDHDHEHEHHHHDHEEGCCCHDHDHEHEHHHHDHEEGCCCHDHDHEHEHHHHHHHGHDADEIFASWGFETVRKYTEEEIRHILGELDTEKYGVILRAKGYVPSTEEGWLHFDYVPGEAEVRRGGAEVSGRVCVIGSRLAEDELAVLFQKSVK